MSDFPHCQRRGLLIETEGGPRVTLGQVFASFAPGERQAWHSFTGNLGTVDEYGLDPAGVEKFFQSLETTALANSPEGTP